MFGRIFEKVKTHPGFFVLIIFLFIISIATIKPDFYLLGWDTYAPYLNLKLNIGRTLFSTWREYRGLGVQSDSEVTDIFRQILQILISPFVTKTTLDQIYLLICLNTGVILMYFFSRSIFKGRDFLSAVSAFFYLFNLNTLATFYFPMIMYLNRFFTLPLLGLVFLYLFKNHGISFKKYLLIFLAFLFSSGSYMTPTIFITFIAFFVIVWLFQEKKRQHLATFLFFILLNAFWLLPFANYTLQKTNIIRLAPTFIEANETQSNKPKSFYSLQKNLILYPNFFETQITNGETGQKEFFHPLASTYAKFPDNIILLIFPVLYLLGSYIIFKKHERIFYWIPVTILFFLFLSLKEYSALGFIYIIFKKITPYFDVLFRFGDTKFHPFIAFSGSIAAAFAVGELIHFFAWRKILLYACTLGTFALTLYGYWSYFNGNLVGYFMYNKIPDAYYKVAEMINSDPDDVRVLHLPVDRDQYWRSYSWGMLESSFFHYLINKAYIDKTFDPGSTENADLNKQIYAIIQNSQESTDHVFQENKSDQFISLLKRNSIRYIVFDESVGAEALPHKKILWGKFDTEDTRSLLSFLPKKNVQEVGRFPIDNSRSLILYEVNDVGKKIEFAAKGAYVDPNIRSLPASFFISSDGVIIQDRKNEGRLYPFLRDDTTIHADDNLTMQFTNPTGISGKYTIHVPHSETYRQTEVVIQTKKQDDSYTVIIARQRIPEINGQNDFEVLKELRINNLTAQNPMLAIGNQVVPLNREISSIVIEPERFDIRLLMESATKTVDPSAVTFTENPSCFNDKVGVFGSLCYRLDLSPYISQSTEYLTMKIQHAATDQNFDLANLSDTKLDSAKPALTEYIQSLPKPDVLETCLKEYVIETCLNNHTVFDLSKTQTIDVLPVELLKGKTDLELFLALKNTGFQKQSLHIKNISITTYDGRLIDSITVPENTNETGTKIRVGDTVTMKLPFDMSKYSYRFNPDTDSFYYSNSPCADNTYRTVRKLGSSYLFYLVSCDNVTFQTLPFSDNNFYLWSLDYNLFSGRFPKYVLEDGFYQYINSYLSQNQGYPDIHGFKAFEDPEWFTSKMSVGQRFSSLPLENAHIFIEPQPSAVDQRQKSFTIQNSSENEGGYLLSSYIVNRIPNSWYDMYLSSETNEKTYDIPENATFKRLLPSLWKINIVQNNATGTKLLVFNEGFDSQWIAIGGTRHMKCNGLVNCYEVSGNQKTIYLLYAPEILSFFGWLITISAFFLFKRRFVE